MYQAVRGTKDIYGSQAELFRFIRNTCFAVVEKYGFSEVMTPIFEFVEVFQGLGQGSDIVNKEMYGLKDRNGEHLVLRPEGTAPIVRMLISHKMLHELPKKFSYFGPMFRYERPQKGRQRQFHQFGVEHFMATTPASDVLILNMAAQILTALGIDDFTLELNSLGTVEEQANYASMLCTYLNHHKDKLSADSLRRLSTNPLRILDSKEECDKELLRSAPHIVDNLGAQSKNYFNQILKHLQALDLPYKLNPRMVRGLDYYTGLVFEFTSNHVGSQNTLLAGGRYNNLVANMGGTSVEAIGFAAGIERLALVLEERIALRGLKKVAIISLLPETEPTCLSLMHKLTQASEGFELHYIEEGNNLSKKLKRANKILADFALILGPEEHRKQTIMVKNLTTGHQAEFPQADIKNIMAFWAQSQGE